jgi:hypothetical protein
MYLIADSNITVETCHGNKKNERQAYKSVANPAT